MNQTLCIKPRSMVCLKKEMQAHHMLHKFRVWKVQEARKHQDNGGKLPRHLFKASVKRSIETSNFMAYCTKTK